METEATDDGTRDPAALAGLGGDLRVAIARVHSRFRSERSEGEIGDAAVLVLVQLQKHGPLSLSDLSERARVTPGSMSQTVNRLGKGGYTVRTRDTEDRRRVLFTLTAQGAAMATAARGHRETWMENRLGALDARERAVLAEAAALLLAIADS